jgi:hypothetical protein
MKINHLKKQAKGSNEWQQITELANKDLQSVVELI